MIRRLLLSAVVLSLAACQSVGRTTPADTGTATASQFNTAQSASNDGAANFDRSSMLSLAAAARDICAEHLPNGRATRDALTEAGLPRITVDNGLWFHGTGLTSLVVAVNGPTRDPLCAIAVRNMTADEARTLIRPWLDLSGADRSAERSGGGTEIWEGTFRGGPVRLGVIDDFNIPGLLRGRAIVAGAI